MKNVFLFIFAALFTLASTETLSAMSIGRDGTSYFENDVEWQKVSYRNDDAGFEALIPGSPISGISNGDVYVHSKYQNVHYEIHCSLDERYKPQKKEQNFIQKVAEAFEEESTVEPIGSDQKTVKYIAEIYHNEGNKITRVYCSKNCLYWAIVEGENLSLAPLFFDSIEITK